MPLDGSYKIYILDECHLFSNGAWNAMLELIEEPPSKTIFIFCTTDPQKIPATILGRVQRYNFTKLSDNQIISRLEDILSKEGINTFEKDALHLIARISKGGMRDSISTMEKCLGFDKNLTVDNVTKSLGIIGFDSMFNLFNHIYSKDQTNTLKYIDNLYEMGLDLKVFMVNFIQYLIDISKYIITNDYTCSSLPISYKNKIDSIKIKREDLLNLIDGLVKLNSIIKYESNPLVFVQAFLLRVSL
jgi:DNA polymerase-3 subunit gamma/tau